MCIADTENGRIPAVDGSGRIITIVSFGDGHFGGDGGTADGARLDDQTGLAADSRRNLYVADTEDLRVRRIEPSGTVSTVAGTGV